LEKQLDPRRLLYHLTQAIVCTTVLQGEKAKEKEVIVDATVQSS